MSGFRDMECRPDYIVVDDLLKELETTTSKKPIVVIGCVEHGATSAIKEALLNHSPGVIIVDDPNDCRVEEQLKGLHDKYFKEEIFERIPNRIDEYSDLKASLERDYEKQISQQGWKNKNRKQFRK